MTTLAVMKSRIADELARDDLTEQIGDKINDAIAAYQGTRFYFSEISPATPVAFNTVIGRSVYGVADSPYLNSSYVFDQVTVTLGNVASPLTREHPDKLTLWNQQGTFQGQPTYYAYQNGSLILSPTPSGVWAIGLSVLRNVAAPTDDLEAGNPWMTDAEKLIRSRAKYELAVHVTRNQQLAQDMSPEPPEQNGGKTGRAYAEEKALRSTTNRLTARGTITPTQF